MSHEKATETAGTSEGAAVGGILLRRYEIVHANWDAFLEIWRKIVVLRERHGFAVLFAFADRENDMFTWAVEHKGDIDAAAEGYYADPDRKELEIISEHVAAYDVTTVERVL